MPAPLPAPPPADAPAGTPSLRTLGTASTQAAAGNDARLATPSLATTTPTAGHIPIADGTGKIASGWVDFSGTGFIATSYTLTTNGGIQGGGDFTAPRTLSLTDVGPGAGTISGLIKNLQLDVKGRVVALAAATGGTDYEHPITVTSGHITRSGNNLSLPNVGPGATTTGGSGNIIESIQTDAEGRIVALTIVSSGGGGGVTSITNGSNIDVDSTIPSAPVVSVVATPSFGNTTFTGTITQSANHAVSFQGVVDFGYSGAGPAITVSFNRAVNLGSGTCATGDLTCGTINALGGNFIISGSGSSVSTNFVFGATTSFQGNQTNFQGHTVTHTGVSWGFFSATPVNQQNTQGTTTGFTAGSGTPANSDSTNTGGVGSSAYTNADVVLALKNYGLLAQ